MDMTKEHTDSRRMLTFVLKLLLLQSAVTEGARILGLLNIPSPSHYIFNRALFVELAKRGHEVTVISADTEKQPVPNMTNILLEDVYSKMTYGENFESLTQNPYKMLQYGIDYNVHACEVLLNTKGAQKLLKHPGPFDLIIGEAVGTDCFLGFVHHFGSPPVMGLSAFGVYTTVAWDFGAPDFPSYIVSSMLNYDPHNMGLWEKLDNTLYNWFLLYKYYYDSMPRHDAVARKVFGKDMPYLTDISRNMSLALVNLAPGVDDPRPLPPSLIPVGGMHIPREPKPLPQDLKAYLDEAKDGFIFFSLGSNLRSADISPEKRKIFLDAFRQLAPVRILWKWEEESLPDQPENVRVRKWLPQGDLLAHPNIRAFMSHCGKMSTLEAIYRGVPVVGIPILWDQITNSRSLQRLGVSVYVDYHAISSTKDVLEPLQQILYNSSYRDNVQYISQVFRCQPQQPLDRAVFWTEFVLRHGHKAAKILKPASVNLSWYEYLLVDVLLVLLSVVIITLVVLFLVVRYIYRILKGTSAKKSKKSKIH